MKNLKLLSPFTIPIVASVIILALTIYSGFLQLQNFNLKSQLDRQTSQLDQLNKDQATNLKAVDEIQKQTERIIQYQRCVSLLRYQNGDNPVTPTQVDMCQSAAAVIDNKQDSIDAQNAQAQMAIPPSTIQMTQPNQTAPSSPSAPSAQSAAPITAPRPVVPNQQPIISSPVTRPTQPTQQQGLVPTVLNGITNTVRGIF